MGRIFEKRKHKMFARWAKMAKAFTRIGKEISMSVKAGGPDPTTNPRLRMAMQNAKMINMPKDRIDAAIQRAANKDTSNYEEMVYEGYGPYGVAILVETATDNPTRTIANLRAIFNKHNGTIGKTGSLDFIFDRKGIFKIDPAGHDLEALELELIDAGLEEIIQDDEGGTMIYVAFNDFGPMQKALEEKGINVIAAEKERIPNSFSENLSPEQMEEINKMIEKLEEDDDVQAVFSNLKTE